MPRYAAKAVGRPRAETGLPRLVHGEPFSLIGVLRCTTRLLSVADCAELLNCPKQTIYKQIKSGKIPLADVGFDLMRVDPAAWAKYLEHKNPHLKPSALAYQQAAA